MNFLTRLFGSDLKSDERKALWKSANTIDQYGISVFQRNIEIKIESNLRAAGLRLHDRTIDGRRSKYIAGTVPELSLGVTIFRDHAQVKNTLDNSEAFCMEWSDEMIPNDHYDAIDEYFKDKIAIHEGAFPRRG